MYHHLLSLFTVEDVQYLQYFIGGSVNSTSLSKAQLTSMDADLNGQVEGVDISYLMKVLGPINASPHFFFLNFACQYLVNTPPSQLHRSMMLHFVFIFRRNYFSRLRNS